MSQQEHRPFPDLGETNAIEHKSPNSILVFLAYS
jgi:hypothetical protein